MGKLAKEFTDIINEQDFVLTLMKCKLFSWLSGQSMNGKNSIKDAMDVFL